MTTKKLVRVRALCPRRTFKAIIALLNEPFKLNKVLCRQNMRTIKQVFIAVPAQLAFKTVAFLACSGFPSGLFSLK